ncbi:MAG TPA: SIMPL domain-containing protein [Longimicrobiales bacterium]
MKTNILRNLIGLAAAAPILAAPADARAQQGPPAPVPVPVSEQTVTVAAAGRVTREPDRAELSLAVETFAATAQEAAAANADKMQALLDALRRLGLDDDDIETMSYQLHPEYDFTPGEPRRPGEQRLVGYRARNMVRVTIDEIARVGEVIDAAIAAGADRVHGVAFRLSDPEEARQDAIRDAIAKARLEAETIAGAIGRTLGPVLAVTTTGVFQPPIVMARMESAAVAAPTPIEPGELDITASVTMVFRLDPRQ